MINLEKHYLFLLVSQVLFNFIQEKNKDEE